MANRISVTSQPLVQAGLTPTLTAPTADGDVIDCGKVILEVTNGSGASITVTVRATATVAGLPVGNLTVTVPASGTKLIGPLTPVAFAQPAGANASGGNDQGRAYVDYSAIATVTRGVISYT